MARVNSKDFDKVLDKIKFLGGLYDRDAGQYAMKAIRTDAKADKDLAREYVAKAEVANYFADELRTAICNYWPWEKEGA